jgi:hypothetical protein
MKRRRANFWLKDFVYKNMSLSSYFLLKQEEKTVHSHDREKKEKKLSINSCKKPYFNDETTC